MPKFSISLEENRSYKIKQIMETDALLQKTYTVDFLIKKQVYSGKHAIARVVKPKVKKYRKAKKQTLCNLECLFLQYERLGLW